MKKIFFSLVLFAFVSAPALADLKVNVDTDAAGLFGTTRGGEFLVTVLDEAIGSYEMNDQFVTFCVEKSETLYDESNYWVDLSSQAVFGGGGPNPDPISDQTAYLYDWWLDGAGGMTKTDALANDVQSAIWHFEQEIALTALEIAANSRIAMANAAVGGGWLNNGQIMVMNLWTDPTSRTDADKVQDLLVRVPVPGAALLGLLGLCAAGMKLRKSV